MRRTTLALLIGVLALTAVAAGCGSDDGDGVDAGASTTEAPDATGDTEPAAIDEAQGVTQADLDGRSFISQEVTGHDLAEGSAIRLSFDGEMLSANAGCNTMNSSYTLVDGTLTWSSPAAATMMACEDALMAQDTWLDGFLGSGSETTLDGDELTLTADDVTLVLLDEQVATPDQPLVGTSWTLESIIANEAVSTVPGDIEAPTLEIADDGTASVFTGCNRGQGTVEVAADGATATFGPLGMTRMFCEGSGSETEAVVTTVLDGEVELALDGDLLTITKGDQGLTYRAG